MAWLADGDSWAAERPMFFDTWHQVLARRWRYEQHINVSEFRAILIWQEAVSAACLGERLDFLDLGDNQVAIAVWSRGCPA